MPIGRYPHNNVMLDYLRGEREIDPDRPRQMNVKKLLALARRMERRKEKLCSKCKRPLDGTTEEEV